MTNHRDFRKYIHKPSEIIFLIHIFASQGFRSRSPLFSKEERGDRERNPWLAKMPDTDLSKIKSFWRVQILAILYGMSRR